jgi:hypothetical protein
VVWEEDSTGYCGGTARDENGATEEDGSSGEMRKTAGVYSQMLPRSGRTIPLLLGNVQKSARRYLGGDPPPRA